MLPMIEPNPHRTSPGARIQNLAKDLVIAHLHTEGSKYPTLEDFADAMVRLAYHTVRTSNETGREYMDILIKRYEAAKAEREGTRDE